MEALQEILDTLKEIFSHKIVYWIVTFVVLALLFQTVKGWIQRRKKTGDLNENDLAIDIHTLPVVPMPKSGPVLEFYNRPVRLALVVIAPAGTGSVMPSADRWNEAFDSILPGLAKIVHSHRPTIRTWPVQLSTSGFASRFAQYVPLPGDRGKGTRYSSVAGTFEMEDRSMLAAMVFEAKEPDRHGQYTVTDASGWLGILRVKEG